MNAAQKSDERGGWMQLELVTKGGCSLKKQRDVDVAQVSDEGWCGPND